MNQRSVTAIRSDGRHAGRRAYNVGCGTLAASDSRYATAFGSPSLGAHGAKDGGHGEDDEGARARRGTVGAYFPDCLAAARHE
jgi:hypothetical protein